MAWLAVLPCLQVLRLLLLLLLRAGLGALRLDVRHL
jgi:hypothetical protein